MLWSWDERRRLRLFRPSSVRARGDILEEAE
jgi:hypothetical protein